MFTWLRGLVIVGFLSACASASALNLDVSGTNLLVTAGTGQSTIVDLVENPDGTLSISAEQRGSLAHLGAFAGTFDYLATIDYNTGTTFLDGDGVLHLSGGDLYVAVHIVEVGPDYPRPYSGLLIVTKGTGRFAKTKGLFEITGVDEESLTDNFSLMGLLISGK